MEFSRFRFQKLDEKLTCGAHGSNEPQLSLAGTMAAVRASIGVKMAKELHIYVSTKVPIFRGGLVPTLYAPRLESWGVAREGTRKSSLGLT